MTSLLHVLDSIDNESAGGVRNPLVSTVLCLRGEQTLLEYVWNAVIHLFQGHQLHFDSDDVGGVRKPLVSTVLCLRGERLDFFCSVVVIFLLVFLVLGVYSHRMRTDSD